MSEALAGTISVPGQRVQALSVMAEADSKQGNLDLASAYADRAIEVTADIDDEFWTHFVREHAASALVAANRINEAVEMACRSNFLGDGIGFVAARLARAGELKRAGQIILTAGNEPHANIPLWSRDDRGVAPLRATAVRAFCTLNDLDRAVEVMHQLTAAKR